MAACEALCGGIRDDSDVSYSRAVPILRGLWPPYVKKTMYWYRLGFRIFYSIVFQLISMPMAKLL